MPSNHGSAPCVPGPPDPVWCPYLLLPRASFTLKAFLLLQPWSGTFTMDISQVYVPWRSSTRPDTALK